MDRLGNFLLLLLEFGLIFGRVRPVLPACGSSQRRHERKPQTQRRDQPAGDDPTARHHDGRGRLDIERLGHTLCVLLNEPGETGILDAPGSDRFGRSQPVAQTQAPIKADRDRQQFRARHKRMNDTCDKPRPKYSQIHQYRDVQVCQSIHGQQNQPRPGCDRDCGPGAVDGRGRGQSASRFFYCLLHGGHRSMAAERGLRPSSPCCSIISVSRPRPSPT